ncbi:MAG: hypothetical protein JWP81_3186 [Ferruginibacter sp.]|nr:hypothetical protein [Ferruginibacter sp.]
MQKIIGFFLLAVIAISCNNSAPKTDTATKDVALPYTASYSSSFSMGKPEYCATILKGSWKDWENNTLTLDNMKAWAADTIIAFHSDNNTVRGIDSLLSRWKYGRSLYSSVIDTIDAVMPVYSTDKKENWVLIWATEISTKTDGTRDTMSLQETYRINKDGKADLLLQYDRAKRKK